MLENINKNILNICKTYEYTTNDIIKENVRHVLDIVVNCSDKFEIYDKLKKRNLHSIAFRVIETKIIRIFSISGTESVEYIDKAKVVRPIVIKVIDEEKVLESGANKVIGEENSINPTTNNGSTKEKVIVENVTTGKNVTMSTTKNAIDNVTVIPSTDQNAKAVKDNVQPIACNVIVEETVAQQSETEETEAKSTDKIDNIIKPELCVRSCKETLKPFRGMED